MRRISAFGIVFGVALAWGAPCAAEEGDPLTRSNTLFEEGKKLLNEGRVADACARFAESYGLAPRGGTLLNLGMCHEREGKLLAARRELRDALATAKRDGRTDREPVATEHLASVEAKLSWIAITPPSNVKEDALEVRVDGAPIDRRDWGAVAVEAGTHVVRISATGHRPREVSVRLQSAEKQIARFEPLEPEHSPVAKPETQPIAPAPRDMAKRPASPSSGLKTAALVTGIAGVAVSLATGAWALERKGVVSDHCNALKQCDTTGDGAASTGRMLVIVSTVAFVVGAAGFGAWLFLPSSSTAASSAGVTFRGVF